MKIKGLIIAVSVIIMASSCTQDGVQNVKLETKLDSVAYAIGVSNYTGMSQQGLEIDPIIMAKGMIDAKDGNPIINDVASRGYVQLFMREKQEEEFKLQYADKIKESDEFLEANAKNVGILVTESGLQYEILEMGDGPKPAETDEVRVHYTGTLLDGTVFDSSVEKGEPAEFPVNGVIQGWIEGLQLMPVGSKFKFYIPYDLAYGSRGRSATITPFSTLIFEVELLDIINPE